MVSYSDRKQVNLHMAVVYDKLLEYLRQKNWDIDSCINEGEKVRLTTCFQNPGNLGLKIEIMMQNMGNGSVEVSCKSSTRMFQLLDRGQNKRLVNEILSLF